MTGILNYRYRDEVEGQADNNPLGHKDDIDDLSAMVTYSWGEDRYSISVYGKNLTDEEVKTSGYCFGSGGCPSTLGSEDNTTVFYAPPRNWTAEPSIKSTEGTIIGAPPHHGPP